MKRIKKILNIISLAIISAGFLSCAEEILTETDNTKAGTITREFTASFETPTKTLIEEGGKVSWCKGDTIWYYTENNGKLGFHIIEEDCHQATLKISMKESDSFILAFYGKGSNLLYKYDTFLEVEGLISAVQTGLFTDSHFTVAQCFVDQSDKLIFHNVSSMLKFTLERDDVHFISFTSNDGTSIWNERYYIDIWNGNTEVYELTNRGANTIYVQTSGTGTYYMSLLPVVLCNGFSIECYDESLTYIGTIRTEKTLTLNKSEILNLGTLDARIKTQDFRVYHSYGPKEDYDIPPYDGDGEPPLPGSDKYSLDDDNHLFSASNGSFVNVKPSERGYGYDMVLLGSDLTDQTFSQGIFAQTDEYGRIENFVFDDRIFTVEYSGTEMFVSTTDDSGKILKTSEITNPYQGTSNSSYLITNKIYRDVVIKGISLFGSLIDSRSLPEIITSGLTVYLTDKFGGEEWENNSWSYLCNSLIGLGANYLTTDFSNTLKNIKITHIAGKVKFSVPWNLLKPTILLSKINVYWLATSMIIDISMKYYDIIEDHKDNMRQLLFSNAYITTLDWKQTKANSVELTCSVVNKAPTDHFKVGIIIGNTILLNKRFHDILKTEEAEDGKITYRMEFSSLQAGRKYYYRAVMIPSDEYESSGFISLDYWAYGNTESFTLSPDYGDEYITAVDLGLSVKWASCNLGATRPEDVGNYYAWAEIEPKDEYKSDNYKYYNGITGGGYRRVTKYCTDTKFGNYDYLRTLTLDDDAAYQKMGGNWRVPNYYEWSELYNSCTWYWTTIDGVKCWKAQSKKKGYEDKFILIPVAGTYYSSKPDVTKQEIGYYWCNEVWSTALTCHNGECIRFDLNNGLLSSCYAREVGLPIRAVLRK